MATISEADIEGLLSACASNVKALTESLNQCFDSAFRLGVGESLPWSASEVSPAFHGGGVAVVLAFGTQSLVCLIPESLPIPSWYRRPNDSQQSRLQTLAMEWSMNLVPETMEPDSYRTVACSRMGADLERGAPADWGVMLMIPVVSADAPPDGPPIAELLLVAPLQKPAFLESDIPAHEEAAAPPPPSPASVAPPPQSAMPAPPAMQNVAAQRARRLLRLPVRVSVRLAEKKIEMGQLLAIAPGALITFNKSCEDLLDLYVNNCKYCRGEAVKIGEKFGLKVNEVGVEDVRESRIYA